MEPPSPPEAAEALDRLSRLPGVDSATAGRLYARGYRDPADVLKLALPERAVRQGLHRTLARRLKMQELQPAPRMRKVLECPTCGAPREAKVDRCRACGSPWEREPPPEEVQRKLEEVAGEVYDLASDPDFRALPTELREEILETFEDAGLATTVESELAEQFQEWKAREIDTTELERILREEGSGAFKEKFVRIVRAQVLKTRSHGRFLCPLCDADLSPAVEECENCGAKFR